MLFNSSWNIELHLCIKRRTNRNILFCI